LDSYKQQSNGHEFPVLAEDNRIIPSLELSETLKRVPIMAIDYVFINPEFRHDGEIWKKQNLEKIIMLKKEEQS